MKKYFDEYDPKAEKNKKLILNNRSSRYSDEMDYLAESINKMGGNLVEMYKNLEEKINERTAQLREQTRSIRALFDSLPIGVLSIDRNGKINSEYTKVSEEILGCSNLSSMSFNDLVLAKSKLSEEEKSQICSAISSSLDEDEINYELNSSHLVREMEILSDKEVSLDITWSYVVDDNNLVSRIIFAFKDVTELKELTAKDAKRSSELKIIGQLLSTPENRVAKTLQEFSDTTQELRNFTVTSNNQKSYKDALRLLHTYKGNSRVYRFEFLSNTIHEFESSLMEADTTILSTEYEQGVEKIAFVLDLYRKMAIKLRLISGEKGIKGDSKKVHLNVDFVDFIEKISNDLESQQPENSNDRLLQVVDQFQRSRSSELSFYLQTSIDNLGEIAKNWINHVLKSNSKANL